MTARRHEDTNSQGADTGNHQGGSGVSPDNSHSSGHSDGRAGARAATGRRDAGPTRDREPGDSSEQPRWTALPPLREGDGWPHRLVLIGLVLIFGGLYLATLHPGVDHNDRAEMQHVVPLLGIAHPPGYAIMMVAGKVFSLLPIPGGVAYRLNLLQALCATITLLLLYAGVRRITGQILPGIVAAGVLGLSSIYWQNALVAEVYAFYGMFLMAGVYFLVRYVGDGRGRWLYLSAIALGICCWNRPSELFVLPAMVFVPLVFFRQFKFSIKRITLAAGLFVLPLLFSLGYFVVRYHEDALYVRDDIQRDKIRGQYVPMEGLSHISEAFRYVLGLKWKDYSEHRRDPGRFQLDREKLIWLLTGRNFLVQHEWARNLIRKLTGHDLGDQNKYARYPGTRGVSGGLPALVLAVLGVLFYFRRAGWWLLGLGMLAGNAAFYFYHVPSNNLDFISPGLMGLALLAGLGCAAWGRPGRRQRLAWSFQTLCLAAPLLLVWSNYHVANRNTPAEHARQAYLAQLATAPLPDNAVILSSRKSAMVYRYLYHIQAGRRDVSVVNENRVQNWPKLARYYRQQGRPVLVKAVTGRSEQTRGVDMPGDMLPPMLTRRWHHAPGKLSEFGFHLSP